MADQDGPKTGSNGRVAQSDAETDLTAETPGTDRDQLRRSLKEPQPAGPPQEETQSQPETLISELSEGDPRAALEDRYIESEVPEYRATCIRPGTALHANLTALNDIDVIACLERVSEVAALDDNGQPVIDEHGNPVMNRVGTVSLRMNGEELTSISVPQSAEGLGMLNREIGNFLREYRAVLGVANLWHTPDDNVH